MLKGWAEVGQGCFVNGEALEVFPEDNPGKKENDNCNEQIQSYQAHHNLGEGIFIKDNCSQEKDRVNYPISSDPLDQGTETEGFKILYR